MLCKLLILNVDLTIVLTDMCKILSSIYRFSIREDFFTLFYELYLNKLWKAMVILNLTYIYIYSII